MPMIALRHYNRMIDELIENGRFDQAASHSRHIIQTFPKYIYAYRSLGRAYLESGQYQPAADILLRLLSSDPDDEIAHLGLSIIREENGQLSQAIWHMEHVYEMHPANPAIQSELLRLLKRRDGREPSRVALSRGALARMYIKGDLDQQAIDELRAGLSEDASRLEWQILLAGLLKKTGQEHEAIDLSKAVVQKLPYCLKANLILLQLFAQNGNKDEAAIYRQRAVAMDPYLAFITSEQPDAINVPDQAVSLTVLENIKTT